MSSDSPHGDTPPNFPYGLITKMSLYPIEYFMSQSLHKHLSCSYCLRIPIKA